MFKYHAIPLVPSLHSSPEHRQYQGAQQPPGAEAEVPPEVDGSPRGCGLQEPLRQVGHPHFHRILEHTYCVLQYIFVDSNDNYDMVIGEDHNVV